jgi:hypothetical protein
MERKWYYAVDGVRQGPVTAEELQVLIESGTLQAADLVWQPDFGAEWRNVGQVRALLERPVPPLAAPADGLPKVTLFGAAGVRPSCLEAAAQAYARVVAVLFKPFDITRWFSMGFCAWLAYIGTQSGNFNGMRESKPELLKQQADGFLDKLGELPDHPGLVAFVIAIIVLSLLLALWMCSLRSRGDFMFLHRWYRPDAPILQCWSASRAAGQALFVWRIQFFLFSVVFFAVDAVAAYLLVVRPYFDAGKVWSDALVRPTIGCVTVAVLLAIAVQVVAHFAKAFVVPVMYWHGVTVPKAWQTVFELCNQYPVAVLGYLSLVMFFWVITTLAILLFILCTCCVGLIPLMLPYFNGVVLLPVLLFFRGFPVCFLSQWRVELVPAQV